ncbi:unnamed protein product [Mytilus coruscus]|uniref:Reverse transcriptase domain-containing protein n=1 Tax=Mytilus coruscus TaxID=42192 RepID=A0A6J8DG57_MYTCO|nr:unnamed protein product [Mytilus coruscus]
MQGFRQGAKLSSLLYKRYNNTILNAISTSNLVAKLGNIQIGSPKCADDIALLGERSDIQAMLGIIEFLTKRDMVKIIPNKSEIICVSKGSKQQPQSYSFNGKEIKSRKAETFRYHKSYKWQSQLNERLKTGRQNIYALLGSGLHARTGMPSHVISMDSRSKYAQKRMYLS